MEIQAAIREHEEMISGITPLIPRIRAVAERMVASLAAGGKILFMGNGGSAADSQHLAAELVGRFTRERRALPAIALSTDTSILTALGNDYGFDHVFRRQVEALCRAGDVVVGLSTSGNSPNVLLALEAAATLGAVTVGLTGGGGGKLAHLADEVLLIPATRTARIQEGHILVGHILCDWVEEAFATGTATSAPHP